LFQSFITCIGRLLSKASCGTRRVVKVGAAHQGLLQSKSAVETFGFEHVADAGIEPLDHPIGLGQLRRRQEAFGAEFGEIFTVIDHYPGDPDRAGPVRLAQKAALIGGVFGGNDLLKHPPCR